MIKLAKPIEELCNLLHEHGAYPMLVGGFIRDHFLKRESKDIDIEVYGISSFKKIQPSLEKLAPVHEVGKNFGVLKMTYEGFDFDISLPRTEKKVSKGHTGFEVQTNGHMDFRTAAKRRDFTMNAIGYDMKSGYFVDPYDGQKDIQNCIIRHVNDNSFTEDPLRVLRAVQFAARFNFVIDANTTKLCQSMVKDETLTELPKERIFQEYKKLLLRSEKPSIGFELLDTLGALFPELKDLQGVVQDKKYHPEGDVWIHTMMSLDAMSQLKTGDDKKDMMLMLAVLCHDLGKVEATEIIEGKVRSIGHENMLKPTLTVIQNLSDEKALLDEITPLIKEHLMPSALFKQKSKDPAIRRLSTRVNIENLVILARADHFGRTTKEAKEKMYPAGDWLLEKAKKLKISTAQPEAFLLGRHLIAEGMKPGLEFKVILKEAYEEQLEGKIRGEKSAINWLKRYLKP